MAAHTVENQQHFQPIFVARQPVFDRELDVWGYELLFRRGDTATAQVTSDDEATSAVISDGVPMAMEGTPPGRKYLINFPQGLLAGQAAHALPKSSSIIEILETVDPTPEVIQSLKELKEAGYTLALDDFVGQSGFEHIIALADIVKVEVLGMNPLQLSAIVKALQRPNLILLAEKVEDDRMFKMCKALGFDLFQGYFFSKPQVLPGRKIPAGDMARLRVITELTKPDTDIQTLAKILQTDPNLSYRLLKYINSAGFNLLQEVTSLKQAVALLGIRPLKQWLMLAMLADMAPTPRAKELTFQSMKRAQFLEMLAPQLGTSGLPADAMFMLGLFSKLDALLDMPMEEVLKDIPLEKDIKAALTGSANQASSWLQLMEALDRGDWDAFQENSPLLQSNSSLTQKKIALLHAKASKLAQDLLNEMQES